MTRHRIVRRAALALALAAAGARATDPCAEMVGVATGIVTADGVPVVGAQVRAQACLGEPVLTDAFGAFTLPMPATATVVTASQPGYYVGCMRGGVSAPCTAATAGSTGLVITLDALPTDDDPAYQFRAPTECRDCHQAHYDEWAQSTMAHTNANRWVDNLYNGTDIVASPGPAPDPNDPPFFGFLQRHNVDASAPERNGECANCHQPAYVGLAPTNSSFNDFQDPSLVGVGCDFCHKIVDVDVSPEGIRRPNLVEGTLGAPAKTTMLRSSTEPWVAFGPLDDVAYASVPMMRGAHAAVVSDSRLCASCHEDHTDFTDANGDFLEEYAGPASQMTYTEWKNSTYAADGIHCQSCHMPSVSRTEICTVAGIVRDESQVHSHRFEGTSPAFLRRAVDLEVTTAIIDDTLTVSAAVTNVGAGHHVPTGVTIRNMILVVDVVTAEGERLMQTAGPVVPNWGGVGDPAAGNFAALPGKGYARVLVDEFLVENVLFTEAVQAFDNRIPAGATDRTEYAFALPARWQKKDVRVHVRLVYRRAFKPLADQRKWNVPLGSNPTGTRGDGTDYDENFVMAESRRFLTCRGRVKRVRGTLANERLDVAAVLKLPKGTPLDLEAGGLRLGVGIEGASADLVGEQLTEFTRDDERTVVLVPVDGGPVEALRLESRRDGRKQLLALTTALPGAPADGRFRLSLDADAVCFRATLRCRTKRGSVRCR